MPAEFNRNSNTFIYLNILFFVYFLHIYIYWNNERTLIRHVGLQLGIACWFLIRHVGLKPSMSVSDGLSIRQVGQ